MDLLDAGCGTGAMLSMFKRDYPERNYTGVDFSEKMIETANRKHIDGIRFVAGDCEDLPFADNSFDVVTCSMRQVHFKGHGIRQQTVDVVYEPCRNSDRQ